MRGNSYWATRLAMADDEAIREIKDAVDDRLAGVPEEEPSDGLVFIGQNSEGVQGHIDSWGKFNGISTGWKNVDALTYGWLEGEVIVMGGEPGVGKSAFIIAMAVNLCKQGIIPTIVSMELTTTQVQIRTAKNYGKGWEKLKLLVQEEQMIKRKDFVSIVRKAKESGSNVIIVDYLQMLKDDTDNEHREISRIVRELKLLALKNKVTIIAISSLNRGRDSNAGLQMKDLNGSGSIEYYADQIIFLEKTDYDNKIQVKIVKNRSNPLNWKDNVRYLNFNGSRFTDSQGLAEPIEEDHFDDIPEPQPTLLDTMAEDEFANANIASDLLENSEEVINLDHIPF